MPYGIIQYTSEGKPICEICGQGFHRVLRHVWLKHGMNQRAYKIKFGFDLHKGICSDESALKSRIKTLEKYDQCVTNNLHKGGEATKFKIGNKARSKDKISEQTLLKLKSSRRKTGLGNILENIDRNIEKEQRNL